MFRVGEITSHDSEKKKDMKSTTLIIFIYFILSKVAKSKLPSLMFFSLLRD